MLRDFQYNPSVSRIKEVLERFKLDYDSEKSPINVLEFEVLSPDSFVWRLLLGNAIYYLYAEDYVSDLNYVKNQIKDYTGSDKWDFIVPRQVITFESASPVRGAEVYHKPEHADLLMEHVVDSGYDFVFLVKSSVV